MKQINPHLKMASTHCLAVIILTDIAGYTAMIQWDEAAALATGAAAEGV